MSDLSNSEAARISRRDQRAKLRAKSGMRSGAAKMLRQIADARDKRDEETLRRRAQRAANKPD